MTNVEVSSTICQDCSLSADLSAPDQNIENPEVLSRVETQENTVKTKTLNCSKFINIYFFNKNIQNQISSPVIQKFISNLQCSILFTGVLLI